MRKDFVNNLAYFVVFNLAVFAILQYAFFQDARLGSLWRHHSRKMNQTKKLIYLATDFFGEQFKFSELPSQCETSTNPKDFQRADAVVVHYFGSDLPEDRRNFKVSSDQVWILVMYESALQNDMLGMPSGFNWTMTYRRDSEIYSPYCGSIEKAQKGKTLADVRPDFEFLRKKGRAHSVAWMVSNCFTINNRMEYAKELSNYIDVDIFGACGSGRCEGPDEVCWRKLTSKYKFYLSFESSHCKDYITEKFILPMYYGVLPIVYGGASKEDYKKIAPPHSYIDTRDFASPKELANYLRKLIDSPKLYEAYFEWRKHYMVFHDRAFVGQDVLCQKLWNLDANRKTYSKQELQTWWKDEICVQPPFFPSF